MEETIVEVDWDSIRVSPFQPRRHFSEEEIEELAASIRSIGLIHPPVVRKILNRDKFLYYELIAGERRWRATKKAGFDKIVVIVRESTDEHAAKATLIENIQRVDLNPLEMAQAFKRLIEVFRMTQEEVADRVGKKRSTVANYLRLLALPSAIQSTLVDGSITMGHAKAILSLNDSELQRKLHELILQNKMTVREAESQSLKIAKKKKATKSTSPSKMDLSLLDIQSKLQEALGTKVSMDYSSKKGGKIQIHYYNLDDLERLLSVLQINCD